LVRKQSYGGQEIAVRFGERSSESKMELNGFLRFTLMRRKGAESASQLNGMAGKENAFLSVANVVNRGQPNPIIYLKSMLGAEHAQ